MKKIITFLCCACLLTVACKRQERPAGDIVELTTSLGKITIRLYDETPLHRDNFTRLVNEHFYDSILFHRVIHRFMIQAGDPHSKRAPFGARLGEGSEGEWIDAEIRPHLFHKRGALAAARLGDSQNPERKSNGSQFYLVQGEIFSRPDLENIIRRANETLERSIFQSVVTANSEEYRRLETANDLPALDSLKQKINATSDSLFNARKREYTEEQINAYTTIGGAPHLDGAYTVFGEVIDGLEVIDKIAALPGDASNRPLQDARVIKARVLYQGKHENSDTTSQPGQPLDRPTTLLPDREGLRDTARHRVE
jgi:peptidylprolyl isomerase/peptidyl-prolyl cis-trans isomerase B (cyclophilin B)